MEAEAIRSLLPDAKIATGFEASKELATSPELDEFRYVHMATHGVFDAQFPERSGLIFSLYDRNGVRREGRLYLPEIYQLGLSADLVVLSACQTALGEEIHGEGLVGMTQGFMYSGTPRVIASLWNVLDESTAALMKLFYQNLIAEKLSPAAALRKAQAEFLEMYPNWSEPYYWAGFILQGDF
jgi:CHAT domain-containing protein